MVEWLRDMPLALQTPRIKSHSMTESTTMKMTPTVSTGAAADGQLVDREDLVTLAKATVMMVDDDPIMIDAVEAFLGEAGFDAFISTTDPEQALAMIRSNKPDVVLLDLMMPILSGFDILERMRADAEFRYVPVIVLTSSSFSETKTRALELGATDYLAKPVDPSELILRLRNTLAFKAYQDQLAYYDTLTGLPNRKMFLERLDSALKRVHGSGRSCALLNFNIDRFRQINDTLGHRTGDELLRAVAHRLEESLRAGDAVGRLIEGESRVSMSRVGGDEFSCLVVELNQAPNAAAIARRTLALFTEPFLINGHELFVTGSIGIAVYPNDGAASDLLMKNANAAMSNAKRQGGNRFVFYSNEMNARSLERLTLENRLRNALSRGELILHYQPKVDVTSGRIVGAEALLRWQSPELGMVSPGVFIPLAEETGLILAIGEWVLFSACRQSKALQEAGHGIVPIAVNVSSVQLRGKELLASISTALEETRLDPRSLILELTESMLMDNAKGAVDVMRAIKALGVQIALDDFGTGYSSLAYLKQLPLDELKIDKSFIDTVTTDSRDAAIVSTVVALAHGLGLKATAEGVETKAQLAMLGRLKCDQYQGFLYSKAVPAERFAEIAAQQLCTTD